MIIPEDYAQVNLMFGGSGFARGAQVTFGLSNAEGATAPDIAGTIAGLWAANLKPVVTNAIALESVKCKLGPNDTGAEATIHAGVIGDLTTNALPPNVAVIANKITDTGGRSNAGKFFWPGASEAQTDGAGLLTTAALASWQAACDGFFDDVNSVPDIFMVVLHSDAMATPTPVVGLSVQQLMAQQHRRLRRSSGHRTP